MTANIQSPEEAALAASNAAARAGDVEATERHWREFVRLLWTPMSATVPWAKQEVDTK
jgi:hypothetical protein